MIRICSEGRESELDPARYRHLGALFADWQATQTARMVVRELEIDGQRFEAPDPALFAEIALGPGSEIRIEAVSARSVALSSLESAAEYAPRVRGASLETARHFRSGRVDLAAPLLAELVDALVVLSGALAAARAELGEAAPGLAATRSELDQCLSALVAAHERSDWIDLADGLEYELTALLDAWAGAIARIAPAAGASA